MQQAQRALKARRSLPQLLIDKGSMEPPVRLHKVSRVTVFFRRAWRFVLSSLLLTHP